MTVLLKRQSNVLFNQEVLRPVNLCHSGNKVTSSYLPRLGIMQQAQICMRICNIVGSKSNLNFLLQMEALYDRQALILEEKLQSLRPLVEKLENNVTVVDDDSKATKTETPPGEDSLKRKLELEKMILAKRLKIEDEDD